MNHSVVQSQHNLQEYRHHGSVSKIDSLPYREHFVVDQKLTSIIACDYLRFEVSSIATILCHSKTKFTREKKAVRN